VTGVEAVTLNLTVVHPSASGFATAYPCGTPPPNASNINFRADAVIANLVQVKLGADGVVCFTSSAPVDLVVDVTGYYAAPLTVGFVPVTPVRAVDTRFPINPATTQLYPATKATPQTLVILNVAGAVASGSTPVAVVANLTGVPNPDYFLWLSVTRECNSLLPSPSSSLNFDGDSAVSNLISAPLTADGSICIAGPVFFGDVIVDIAGFFAPVI
jgi:hypothetical protein